MRKSVKDFCKILSISFALMLFTAAALAQTTVSGKVTDSKDGSPVSGVTVNVKGTKVSVITGSDGTYKLVAPSGKTTLVFTSIGFAPQEAAIGAEVNISFVQSSTQLNDVVVIGYGTAKKKDLTGAVTAISSKDFQKGAITTPEQLIAGKVAGVSITSNGGAPGAGSTIRIRGGASLSASNDPLIVVDGVPLDNGGIAGSANALALINPNDIETFNILKDASATAIYGSRASNGVIIITTKKGRKGKTVFSFNTQISAGMISRKADVLSASEFRDYVNANGTTVQKGYMGTANTDWQDEIYNTAIGSDNNLSIAGGIQNMPYRVSLGYLNQNGILRTGNLQRTSIGINLSPRFLNDHLKVDLNLKGANNKSRFADEGAIGSAVNFDPTQSVKSSSSKFGSYYEWLDAGNANTGLKQLAPRNPVGLLEQRDDRSNVNRIIANIQVDYKFHWLPELRANINLGIDKAKGTGTVKVNDSAASTYRRDVDVNNVRKSGVNNSYKQEKSNTVFEAYLAYARDIKSIASRFDVMAGYSYQDFYYNNYNYADYFYDGTKRKNSDPQFATDKPQNRLISFYGRMNFTVKDRYLFTASIRRDGSSRFSNDNRWGIFPSGAFAWKIKEEDFLKDNKVINDLKLRIGYGVTGQQDGIGNYDFISYYALGNTAAQYQFGNTFYNIYRPGGYYASRKWEQTATTNVGIDYAFANNRITGSIDFYIKKTEDLLNNIGQPAGNNFSNQIVANVGNMENKGVEILLNTQPIRKQDFTWDFGVNFTYNKNEITNLTAVADPNYPGNKFGGISGGTGNTILINSVGYNRGAFYTYKQVYDAAGKPVEGLFEDINRDGIINDKDLYRYKGVDPKMLFGINTNVVYKKWNAGFVMRANLDNYMYNNINSSTGISRNILNPLGYLSNGSKDILTSGITGYSTDYYLSDYYIQNASFLRMDNINVGYNMGKVLKDKASLRLNFNVQNVFIITKYKGVDPEIGGGIDNNFYPRPRTFVFGANLDF